MQALAAIHYDRGYDVDRILNEVSQALCGRGIRVGGLLQVAGRELGSDCMQSVHLVDLLTQESFSIWEDRGVGVQGCRLSANGLAEAEAALTAAVEQRVDLLIVNRFGRAESEGHGVRQSIERAVPEGIAVLTAVRAPYDAAWEEFHGGMATDLPCSNTVVIDWAMAATVKAID